MSCTQNQLKNLPCCFQTLHLGKLSAPKSNLWIIFENLATGNTFSKQFSTDASGNIDVEVSEIPFPAQNPFEISLVEDIAKIIRLPFVLDGFSSEVYFARVSFTHNEEEVTKAYAVHESL